MSETLTEYDISSSRRVVKLTKPLADDDMVFLIFGISWKLQIYVSRHFPNYPTVMLNGGKKLSWSCDASFSDEYECLILAGLNESMDVVNPTIESVQLRI